MCDQHRPAHTQTQRIRTAWRLNGAMRLFPNWRKARRIHVHIYAHFYETVIGVCARCVWVWRRHFAAYLLKRVKFRVWRRTGISVNCWTIDKRPFGTGIVRDKCDNGQRWMYLRSERVLSSNWGWVWIVACTSRTTINVRCSRGRVNGGGNVFAV